MQFDHSTFAQLPSSVVQAKVLLHGAHTHFFWISTMSVQTHIELHMYQKNLSNLFLANLSRRLIGELIVYPCSVVRPSSTISKIFFSQTAWLIVLILHIHHLQVGGKNNCVFCFDRIRTLVTMVTYASHRLIREKSENCQFLLSCWRYLNFVFAEMFIE